MTRRTLVFRPGWAPLSLRVDARVPPVLFALALVTLAALVISVGYGEYRVPPIDVIRTVLGLETSNPDYAFIVNTLRLPRALVALLVGMSLGVSGAILQGLTRNPLADPGIIGVNQGASLAAVTLIVMYPDVSVVALPLAAFGGALVATTVIYLLAWKGGSSPIRLILIGVGLAAIVSGFTTVMITFGEITAVQRALIWMTGSVYGRTWEQLRALLPWVAIFIPIALFSARHLNTLNLGDEVARGLGSTVERYRLLLILSATALAGASVATAGAFGFVGLMAPHIARRLVGPAHGGLLPAAALTCGMLVVVADLLGRTLFAPIEIPCGLITAIIGAPFFIYLLVRGRRA
jgi:iron complex transport system permease protein